MASEILSAPQNELNSTKSAENDEKSRKTAQKDLKREIAVFDEIGEDEMGKKAKKTTRQVHFKNRVHAKEFVWVAYAYGVKVKDVQYDDLGVCTVTIKGREKDIFELGKEFDKHLKINEMREDRQMYRETRRRTAVLANALACREALMVYLLNNCRLGEDDIADIEDVIDPIVIDLAHELMKDRPGPSGAIADAYVNMVGDVHESD